MAGKLESKEVNKEEERRARKQRKEGGETEEERRARKERKEGGETEEERRARKEARRLRKAQEAAALQDGGGQGGAEGGVPRIKVRVKMPAE